MHQEADKNLTLTISGPAMEADGGFELNYLTDTLESFEKIIEKTYLYSSGKARMSEEDRNNLKIILKNPSKGSFVADIVIQIRDLTLALTPFIAQNGPTIWAAVKKTYEYLKLVIDAKKKGKEIVVNNNGDGIINLNIGNGSNINTYSFPEYTQGLAEKLLPEFVNATKNIDGEKISSIDFIDNNEESITLDFEDREIFKTTTALVEDVYTLKGQIVVSNSKSYTGKIDIHENDYEIEPGEYSFTVDKNLTNRSFFKSKYLVVEDYLCQLRLKIDLSNLDNNHIHNIHILSAKD